MKIRSVTPNDADSVATIYSPIVRDTFISFEWVPPEVEDLRGRIARTLKKYPWLGAEDEDGTMVGFTYASTHRDAPSYQWSVNTSVYVRDGARGRGIGKALYQALHVELVELGYYRAFAAIALPNAGSVALHESAGYQPLGVCEKVGFKLGAWRDVGWWQKQLQPPCDGTPAPPALPAS